VPPRLRPATTVEAPVPLQHQGSVCAAWYYLFHAATVLQTETFPAEVAEYIP